MLEADPRVQVVFTHAPSALVSGGVREFLARLGGVVVPWRQATQTRFDLALAASDGLLEWVHAPVITMLHGAGYNKYPAQWDGPGAAVPREAAGPERTRLVCHGRTIASAIMLPTRGQVERLRRSCPEAAAIAVAAGDPCYDRLSVSLASRCGINAPSLRICHTSMVRACSPGRSARRGCAGSPAPGNFPARKPSVTRTVQFHLLYPWQIRTAT
jgi:hypothetical protein